MTTTLSGIEAAGDQGGMPLVRNLLFPNKGSAAYPEVDQALASMNEPDVVALDESVPDTGVSFVLYPGSFVPTVLAKAIKFALMSQFALPDAELGDILLGGFGFQPIPNPRVMPVQASGGMAEFNLLSHPVYWLPPEVRDADFWADPRFAPWRESLEQIRLWMELSLRGVADMERGDFVDVLAAAELDPAVDGDLIREAYQSSLNGSPNDLFTALSIPEPSDVINYGAAAPLIAATFAIDYVRNGAQGFQQVELDVINSRTLHAMELFRSVEDDETTTVEEQMEALEVATRALIASAGSKEDFDAFESWALGRVDVLSSLLEETYVPLTSALALRRSSFNRLAPEFIAMEQSLPRAFDEVDRLEEHVSALIDQMRASDRQTLPQLATQIWNAIGEVMTKVIAATDQVWTESMSAGFIKDAEWELALPPFLAVPDGAKAGLTRWFTERGAQFSGQGA